MNKTRYILLTLLFFCMSAFLYSCKKDDQKPPSSVKVNVEEELKTNLNVMHNAVVVYNDEWLKTGDSLAAFNAMRAWLASHEEVKDGWVNNVESMDIEFKNGLKSPINIIPVSSSGEHLKRGGGSGSGSLKEFQLKTDGAKTIKNKKVLLLIPYPTEFNYSNIYIQSIKKTIEDGRSEMEVDVEVGSAVTLSDLNKLGDYGLVILDVHGTSNGFFLSYLKKKYEPDDLWFPEDIIAEAFNVQSIPQDKIANGQIRIGTQILSHDDGTLGFRFTVLITEDYIRQLNVDMNDAVVFGNHCYSGHTAEGLTKNNLPEAWKSKGVATYYGYAFDNQISFPVDNIFCKDMEQLLIKGLVIDGDSTGSAHLKPDGSSPFYYWKGGYEPNRGKLLTEVKEDPAQQGAPLYLIQYHDKEYRYEGCEEGTFTDSRDGQVYKTVKIGEQVWMAENLRYLPVVHTNAEFAEANDNDGPGYGVYGYSGTSTSAAKSNENYKVYGVLYNWWAAMDGQSGSTSNPSGVRGICPATWHLPSVAEWRELSDFTGHVTDAGAKLKAGAHWSIINSTNEYCFSAVGGGSRGEHIGDYRDFNYIGYHWTTNFVQTGIAMTAGFSTTATTFQSGQQSTGAGYSCRCVKD